MPKLIPIIKSLLEACYQARAALPDAWSAVHCKVPIEVIDLLNSAIAVAETAGFAPSNQVVKLVTSWEYFKHGEHKFFHQEDWRSDVSDGNTLLGYQKWVEHNLESLLNDTNLEETEDVYITGMTESGVVDEDEASFFSVYSRIPSPNERVEDICDFNTKDQAIEFAEALTSRFGKTYYSSTCNIQSALLLENCSMQSGTAASCQHCEECNVELPDERPVLAIMIEGGLVQCVISDKPELFNGIDVLVYDYDTEGADEDEMIEVHDLDGEKKEAVGRVETVTLAGIDIKTTIGGV